METTQRVIALGYFDGVHLGHAALLKRTAAVAQANGLTASALTFRPHPDALVHGTAPLLLNTTEERFYLMRRYYGIEELLMHSFDRRTMQQPWENFAEEILLERYRATYLVCGYDFRFGAGGRGTASTLKTFCEQRGIGFSCMEEVRVGGQTVSSTRIRALLEDGRMQEAVACLGHPHLMSGRVVSGRKLGRTLGIPTANFIPEGVLLPRFGVYAAKAYFDEEEHLAVVNIGTRPTVDGHRATVEPWILDFEGDLYGKLLRLDLCEFLRPEVKFASVQALREEILKNADQTRAFFAE